MQPQSNDYTQLVTLSNTQFLISIFGEQWVNVHVTSFLDDPSNIFNDRHKQLWAGGYYRYTALNPDSNQFFTVSVFTPDERGYSRRQKIHFVSQHCVVLDDVREKLSAEEVKRLPPPSWVLETSEGSEHWGYILETPCTDRQRLDNLTDGLIESDLAPDSKDPGMRGVTRYMRLPEGINTKASKRDRNGNPFNCRLLQWSPTLKYTLEDLAKPFNIDLTAPRLHDHEVQGNPVDMPDHPVLKKLNIKANNGKGKLEITCPWIDEHSENNADNGTALWTHDNFQLGFKCHHGHCEHRRAGHLITKLRQDDPTFDAEYRDWSVTNSFADAEDLFPDLFQPATPDNPDIPDSGFIELIDTLVLKPLINLKILYIAWKFSFETGCNNKISILKSNGTYYSQPKTCGHAMLKASFGSVIHEDKALIHFSESRGEKDAQKAVEAYQKYVTHLFFTYLSKHKQVNTIQYDVDLYATESRLEITRDAVKLTSIFEPFKVDDHPEDAIIQQVVTDYVEHFPYFMAYLESVAAARFAPDRRHAGIWIHAGTGWGKSFLMQIFKNLNIVAPLTETQVKTCCSGSPVGLSPNQFLNAWIVEFDEFKTVNSDMKRINNTMTLSPKNQLSSEVNIYNKTFLSAEVVSSLLGEYGVEAQFSERIAYLPLGEARLDERPLFNQDKMIYLSALTAFVADYLNKHVKNMRLIGRKAAEKGATNVIKTFHTRHNFDQHHSSIVEGVEELTLDIQELITKLADPIGLLNDGEIALKRLLRPVFIYGEHPDIGPVAILKRPYKFIENYINHQVSKSEQSSLQLKKYTMLEQLDPEWKTTRRIKTTEGLSKPERGLLIELSGIEVLDFL